MLHTYQHACIVILFFNTNCILIVYNTLQFVECLMWSAKRGLLAFAIARTYKPVT